MSVESVKDQEIAHWEKRTTEAAKLAVELAMCFEALETVSRLWSMNDPEDRRRLAHSLFEYLVYDFDTQRITDFRLKPWADRFLMLPANLYELEAVGEVENLAFLGRGTNMPSRGIDTTSLPRLTEAVQTLLTLLYAGSLRKSRPLNNPKSDRNAEIRALHAQGWSGPQIAAHLGISKARVYQIPHCEK